MYHLAAQSSVARSWADPVGTALLDAVAPAAVLAAAESAARRRGSDVRVLIASSAEIFAGTTTSPQDETTPLTPTNPYGAAKAHAHLLTRVHRERGLHAVAAVLYPHESPAAPPRVRHPQDHLHPGRDRPGRGRRDRAGQHRRAPGLGLGPGRGGGDGRRAAPRRSRRTTWWPPASRTRSRTSWPPRRVGPAWTTGATRLRVDPALLRPTDAAELVGDATRARTILGWAPTRSFADVVAAMVDADLADGAE